MQRAAWLDPPRRTYVLRRAGKEERSNTAGSRRTACMLARGPGRMAGTPSGDTRGRRRARESWGPSPSCPGALIGMSLPSGCRRQLPGGPEYPLRTDPVIDEMPKQGRQRGSTRRVRWDQSSRRSPPRRAWSSRPSGTWHWCRPTTGPRREAPGGNLKAQLDKYFETPAGPKVAGIDAEARDALQPRRPPWPREQALPAALSALSRPDRRRPRADRPVGQPAPASATRWGVQVHLGPT